MTRRHRDRGADPSRFESLAGGADPHAAMLASQVEEGLRLGLALLDDPALLDVTLRDVVHDAGALVATVECDPIALDAVGRALARASSRLRAEVAAEIHRKRMPHIRFVVVPRTEPS